MLIIDDARTCPTCGAYLEAPGYYCANGHLQPRAQAPSWPSVAGTQPSTDHGPPESEECLGKQGDLIR